MLSRIGDLVREPSVGGATSGVGQLAPRAAPSIGQTRLAPGACPVAPGSAFGSGSPALGARFPLLEPAWKPVSRLKKPVLETI